MENLGVRHVYTTGDNSFGQLGLGFDTDEAHNPTIVAALENIRVKQVVCGACQTWLLTENGRVLSVGNNDEGSLGRLTNGEEDERTPGQVQLPDVCIQIAGGDSHCAALLQNGDVCAWGSFQLLNADRYGVDFRKEEALTAIPVVISTDLPRVVKIASGAKHLVLLCENGEVCTFGSGYAGQLGRKLPDRFRGNVIKYLLEPSKVHLIKSGRCHKAIDIWAGGDTTFIQCKNTLWVCGCNNWNQCGVSGERVLIVYPTTKNELGGQKWKCIAGGDQHTIALNSEGVAYSFGRNLEGQCGMPRKEDGRVLECGDVPNIIPGLETQIIQKVAAGSKGSFAINEDGNLFVWGVREYIGLGDEVAPDAVGIAEFQEEPRRIALNGSCVNDVDGGGTHSAMVITFNDPLLQ